MQTSQLQEQRWALMRQRRALDLSQGLVGTVDRPGFASQVLGLTGWRRIYQEDKNYVLYEQPTPVEVYASADDKLVAKIDDAGMLLDQASALVRLQQMFGVTIPRVVQIVQDGERTFLVMEKLRWINGWHIREEAKVWYRRWFNKALSRESKYTDLYRQGRALAKSMQPYLRQIPYDVVNLHHGNWGVSLETFANWKRNQKLEPAQLVVLDPVAMQYRKPGATEIRNEKEASNEFLRQL